MGTTCVVTKEEIDASAMDVVDSITGVVTIDVSGLTDDSTTGVVTIDVSGLDDDSTMGVVAVDVSGLTDDSITGVVTIDESTLEDIIPESVTESTIGVPTLDVTLDS